MSDSVTQSVLLRYVQTAPSSAACPKSMQHARGFPAHRGARTGSLNTEPGDKLNFASVAADKLAKTEVQISTADLMGKKV